VNRSRRFLCRCNECGEEAVKYLLNIERGISVMCSLQVTAARKATRDAIAAERRAASQQSDEGRMCLTCQTWKPWSGFSRDPRKTSGKASNCMECSHWNTVKSVYGITHAEWDWLLGQQGGSCALCREGEKNSFRLSVDHDHACCGNVKACKKCIRGMLCKTCNRLLGHIENRPLLALRFADYLAQRPFMSAAGGADPVLEDVTPLAEDAA